MPHLAAAVAALLVGSACAAHDPAGDAPEPATPNMQQVAGSYVKLVLAVGTHDADHVDAYYGPPEWRAQADSARLPLAGIRARATTLLAALGDTPPATGDSMVRLRHGYLTKQLQSLVARVEMLEGRRFTFDEESRALYDAVAPTNSEAHFRRVLERLERVLPGDGPLPARYEAFRSGFVIPPARLDTVFDAAIAACRARTERYVDLPPARASSWNT